MSVAAQFKAQCDHLAAYRKALIAAVSTRDDLWDMIDAAEDETYENRVEVAEITTLDTNLDAGDLGNYLSTWFSKHGTYFSQDTAYASLNGALAAYKWRVSQFFNELYHAAQSAYLTVDHVYPRDTLDLGNFAYTGAVFTNGSAVDTVKSGMGKMAVQVINQTIGALDLVLSVTCKRRDDTTVALAKTVAGLAVVGTQYVLGEQALSNNAASGQKVVPVAATAQFKAAVGERVLLEDVNGLQEWGIVDTLITNTSITLTVNLTNSFTTANSAKVTPLFKDVTACSASAGNAGDDVGFVIAPDRTVALVA